MKEFPDSEIDQHVAALVTNSGAVRAVTEAVQGTLGPKGLDCMLVDSFGSVMITNDGVTILKTMDVTHPAARILISAAEHQEEQVGDGTTTTTVLAGALIAEGVNQIIKGVPVIKVIEGIKTGIAQALIFLKETVTPITDLNSPILDRIAIVAARDHQDLARLITKAARIVGPKHLEDEGFKLADQVIALEASESELVRGTIINREPLNIEMPRRIHGGKILILADALVYNRVESEALATEAGFNHQLQQEQELTRNIQRLADIGVKAVFTDRAISDSAEDLLTDLGIIGVQGVASCEWRRLAELTGARPVKRGSLAKSPEELRKITGEATEIIVDEKFKQIRVLGEPDRNFVTILVGAYTKEVVGERERIAKDAAAAVQAAWRGGVVPGGGSVELGVARNLAKLLPRDMTCYGFHCVVEALKRPIIQICTNAGFNPLEKVEVILGIQEEQNSYAIGINCETGMAVDLSTLGIWDPFLVKHYAIQSAGEVGEAILRINNVIKMKEEQH